MPGALAPPAAPPTVATQIATRILCTIERMCGGYVRYSAECAMRCSVYSSAAPRGFGGRTSRTRRTDVRRMDPRRGRSNAASTALACARGSSLSPERRTNIGGRMRSKKGTSACG